MITRAVVVCLLAFAALPALAQQKVMIADPTGNCGTSNPFPRGNERITWTGNCRNGLLDGPGVLTWYRDDRLTERNEGTFRNGEMNGEVTTTFPDGSSVVGIYSDGRRNGEFVVMRGDGTYIRALYQNDRLVSERELSRRQVRALIDERRNQPAQARPREAPAPESAQAAPVYQPQPAYAAPLPAARAAAPTVAAAAVPVGGAPIAAATAMVPASPPPMAASSYVPPWSPTANAAAISGQRAGAYAAPAPVYQQPAYQQPAYQPSVYAAPVAAPQPAYNPYAVAAIAPPAPQAAARAAPVAAPPSLQPTAVAAPTGMVSRRVCTALGLYPNNAGWCGIVRAEQPGEVQVEITDVRVNSIFAIGISPGECTGSEFIGTGSKGSKVWVPARCMR